MKGDNENPVAPCVEVPPAPCSEDRCPITIGKALPQAEGVVAQAVVEQKVKSLSDDVVDIRWSLIKERFAVLDQKALSQGWGENPVVEGNPEWESYQEWLYVKNHQKELQKGLSPEVPARVMKPQKVPVANILPVWSGK